MADKISPLISAQLPDFVHEEGPLLEAFIKAYYEWMEESGKMLDRSRNLLSYQDIDTTLDDYIQYFRDEIYPHVPDSIETDKRLLAKQIQSLYRSKGSEKSFKFLFRALYNEDIDIYFPGDYVLRTSDGRWQQDTVVRVTGISLQDAESIAGQLITGQTSGAYGRVENVTEVFELGILVVELTLSNIIGTFLDNETVISDYSGISAVVYSSSGSLQDVVIQRDVYNLPRGAGGGLFHRSGDLITFTSDAGSGANAVIISTDDKSAINVAITDGGSGYINNLPITIINGSGYGATAKISGIGSTEVLSICTDTISPVANVPLNTGATFVSTGANTSAVSANLAAANIYSSIITGTLFTNVTTGTITQITTTNYGINYSQLPAVSATFANVANEDIPDGSGGFKGKNAVLYAVNLPGTITAIRVNAKGSSYSKVENIGLVNQTRAGTINAIGTPVVTGVETKEGHYISTKGFLSWDQRLQDSTFWQDFSYVIRSEQFVDKYRNVVKHIAHPAGTKMFGEAVLTLPFDVVTDGSPNITNEPSVIIYSTVNSANSSNVTTAIDPPYNESPGLLFVFNYANLAPFFAATVGTGVPTTINAFGEIAAGDLNSAKLVFGNNTTFNSNNATLPGYVRQLPASSNTLIGNGGTDFTVLNVGDIIYGTNTAGSDGNWVKIVSIAGASSMVTSPSLNTSPGFFQYTANTTSGAQLKLPPALLATYDVVIFDTYGGAPDGQYAVNVVSSTVNSVFTITSPYAGPTLSNGSFSYIDPGVL